MPITAIAAKTIILKNTVAFIIVSIYLVKLFPIYTLDVSIHSKVASFSVFFLLFFDACLHVYECK